MIAGLVLVRVFGPGLLKLSPEEVAQEWVESNIDATGEEIAEFLLGSHWVVRELGGEYVESRINDTVQWQYVERPFIEAQNAIHGRMHRLGIRHATTRGRA